MNIYKNKYIKYKQKYYSLKYGGSVSSPPGGPPIGPPGGPPFGPPGGPPDGPPGGPPFGKDGKDSSSNTISEMVSLKEVLLAIIRGDEKNVKKYKELKEKEDKCKEKFMENITKQTIAEPAWGFGPTTKAKWYLEGKLLPEREIDSMMYRAKLLDKIYSIVGKKSNFQEKMKDFPLPKKFSLTLLGDRNSKMKKVLEDGKFTLLLHAIGRDAGFECHHTFVEEPKPPPNWAFLIEVRKFSFKKKTIL